MNLGPMGQQSDYNSNLKRKFKKKYRSYLVSERFLLSIIKILASDATIMRRQLINIKRFLDVIDRDYYTDNHIEAMLIVCDSLLESKMKLGSSLKLEDIIFNVNLLLQDEEYEEVKNNLIIPQIQVSKNDSVETELAYVSESLDQNLKNAYILDSKDELYDLTTELTTCSYKDFPTILGKYRELLTSIMNFFRSTDNSATDMNQVAHTSDPSFYDFLFETFNALNNPASALQTGWVAMNSALGPRGGFQNKNVYMYYANTNSFKSALLLHLARMIKEYNAANVIERYKQTGKIPTILFIEAENDFDEDNERLFKTVVHKDITKCTSKEELFSTWEHTFDADKDKNPIDISLLHVDSRSMSVDDIERVIELLDEEGYDVIATIIDYIGLLKPRAEDMNIDNRIQLKHIADDLLSLAKNQNIPVITAHQLNRSGGAVLTNLKMQGESNAVSQITNEYISESIGIEQAVSWSMFIDIEEHEGRRFLTCKRNKCRKQNFGITYFVMEIKNGIIIDDDLYLPEPLYFKSVPGTSVEQTSNNDTGQRGVIDIRDKPKTPPKGHELSIKPANIIDMTSSNDLQDRIMDLIKPQDWFEYIPTYGYDKLVEFTDELSEENTYRSFIGSTEYNFMNDDLEEQAIGVA